MESNEIVARGHFWLEDADSAVAGELKYSPQNGASVYLFGALERLVPSDAPIRYPVVRGHTESLGWVSLLDTLVVNQLFGTRPTASELHSNLVIHSTASNDFSSAPILRLTAKIDCLHEWVGVSGFSFTPSPNLASVQVTFRTPDALEFDVGDDRVALGFGRTGPAMHFIQKEATISQSTYISINFSKPTTLRTSREKLLALKDLIALGIGRSLSWRSVDAKFAVVSTEGNGSWASILDRPVGTACNERIHPSEMLFTFGEVQHRFGQVLNAWLRIGDEAKPLYMLYSATTRGQTLYSEHRLFNFFQAHRVLSPHKEPDR